MESFQTPAPSFLHCEKSSTGYFRICVQHHKDCRWLQLLGSKNYVYQATNILYHMSQFCCRTLQQNWVYSFKLSKNSKAG